MTKSESKAIQALDDRFARVSWRLALRLGYADHIELVRSTMNRFMESHILNHLLDLNEDPVGGDSNDSVSTLHRRSEFMTGGPGVCDPKRVRHIASGSFFGSCFLAVEVLDSPLTNGNVASTYWGLSKDLYMQPVHERILRLGGTAPIVTHNLNVIEKLLRDTVGQTERHKPTVQEVLDGVKHRKEALQQLVGKSAVFNRVGLVRRHVLGQPVGFVSRTPIS